MTPEQAEFAKKADDMLLPGIANCSNCHNPGRDSRARSDCVECHRYHNGDSPLAGKGSPARDAPRQFSLDEFTKGFHSP